MRVARLHYEWRNQHGMNASFRTYSARVLPLNYDALGSLIGTEALNPEPQRFGLLPFATVSFTDHDTAESSPFNSTNKIGQCSGPQNSPGIRPFFRQWYAFSATAGIRITKDVPPTLPGDATGESSSLFPTTPSDFVSIAFNGEGLMVLAIDAGNNSIQIKRFSDSSGTVIVSPQFLGKCPLLFYLGNIFEAVDNINVDVVCIYIRPDSTSSIYCRFKADNFATEYVLNQDAPAFFTSLVSVGIDNGKMILRALDAEGRDATFESVQYSNDCRFDKGISANALKSLSYFPAAVPQTVPSDKSKASFALQSLLYIDTVVVKTDAALSADKSAASYALQSLEYL